MMQYQSIKYPGRACDSIFIFGDTASEEMAGGISAALGLPVFLLPRPAAGVRAQRIFIPSIRICNGGAAGKINRNLKTTVNMFKNRKAAPTSVKSVSSGFILVLVFIVLAACVGGGYFLATAREACSIRRSQPQTSISRTMPLNYRK